MEVEVNLEEIIKRFQRLLFKLETLKLFGKSHGYSKNI